MRELLKSEVRMYLKQNGFRQGYYRVLPHSQGKYRIEEISIPELHCDLWFDPNADEDLDNCEAWEYRELH